MGKELWAVCKAYYNYIDDYYPISKSENIYYTESFDDAVDYMINVAIYKYVIELGSALTDVCCGYSSWEDYYRLKSKLADKILEEFARSRFSIDYGCDESEAYSILQLHMNTNYAMW